MGKKDVQKNRFSVVHKQNKILYTVAISDSLQDFFFWQAERGDHDTMTDKLRDGELYRIIELHGHRFEIRYGYYEEYERGEHEPVPIFPDFLEKPIYTDEGHPFVTATQTVCPHFVGVDSEVGCFGCQHYQEACELIGICQHPEQTKNT